MLELREYQSIAVDEVVENTLNAVNDKVIGIPQILLVAPTGAGKTVMGSQILVRLREEFNLLGKQVNFIWISIGKGQLHLQSKESLERNAEDLSFYSKEDIESGIVQQLDNGDVLILSWDQVTMKDSQNNWINLIMRENEANNLQNVMSESKKSGVQTVLIIDESHSSTDTGRALEVINIINPIVQIGVTATPKDEQLRSARFVTDVPTEKVIESGMIKSTVEINKGIKATKEDMISALLSTALKRKEKLSQSYEKCGSYVNPLILIQIPNSEQGDRVFEEIQIYLEETHNITTDNGRMAVWLTVDKYNLDNLEKLDGTQDVLIFKSAIDTGWDCPRAQILVKFRDMKSETFKKQIVGRILRMPEQKHYKRQELNTAYIYTDEQDFKMDDSTILEKLEILNKRIGIKEEFKELSYLLSFPTYSLPKNIKPQLNIDNLLTTFIQIFDSQHDILWKTAEESENLSKSEIISDATMSISDMKLGTMNINKVILEMSSPMLKSLVYKHIKNAIVGNSNSMVIMDAILSLKEKGIKAKEYYKMLACNALNIETILKELVKSNFSYPSVDPSEIVIEWFNIEESINVQDKSTAELEPEAHKCVYNDYVLSKSRTTRIMCQKLDNDDRVQFWYPNYQFNKRQDYQVKIPDFSEQYFKFIIPDFVVRYIDGKISLLFIYGTEEEKNLISDYVEGYITSLNMPNIDYACMSAQDILQEDKNTNKVLNISQDNIPTAEELDMTESEYEEYLKQLQMINYGYSENYEQPILNGEQGNVSEPISFGV